jgi:oxygen-independent coproporphyrinogen III oxidase
MNLGVYVQVPFCRTKCTYCNFHTGVFSKSIYSPYCEAVIREIREHRERYQASGILVSGSNADEMVVDTVYVGGGTPSLLDPEELQRVVFAIQESFATSITEATLEADPETITAPKAEAWLKAGIDRISLGTQSFNDSELAAAGRLHRSRDIHQCVEILRSVGYRNISFDLIAGLAHQTTDSWKRTVNETLALEPEHISIYMLEIDEGSRLGRESLAQGTRYSAGKLPPDDQIADSYDYACGELAAAGYVHYEISNWAKPGLESKHNLKYWRREPYFGFGAGAHSFYRGRRWANAHDPASYVAAMQSGNLSIEQDETLDTRQALDEELFLGLRLNGGIDIQGIEARYKVSLRDRISALEAKGLLLVQGSNARLAPEHISISNEVFVELMS